MSRPRRSQRFPANENSSAVSIKYRAARQACFDPTEERVRQRMVVWKRPGPFSIDRISGSWHVYRADQAARPVIEMYACLQLMR
jgi:hypothetical protein